MPDLTQTPDDLLDKIAWAIKDSAYLLPEAPRKGRVRPSPEDCRAISRKVAERLKLRGVVDLRRRVANAHSFPADESAKLDEVDNG
jgi:hypothetical protein